MSLGSININGFLQPADSPVVSVANRAFRYGDAVFESIRFAKGRVCFLEKHISRLLGTMKLMRMEIPATFNAPYFEEQIQTLLLANGIATSARIRLSVQQLAEAPLSGGVFAVQTGVRGLPEAPFAG